MNAMQQALEALEMFSQCDAFAIPFKPLTKEQQRQGDERVEEVYEAVEKAITALRAALAEPEQELGQALKRAIEHINELESELHEQARLNGMGSEREARLMASNTELVEAVKAEREACAQVCEELVLKSADGQLGTYIAGWSDGTDDCAAAIRSRT